MNNSQKLIINCGASQVTAAIVSTADKTLQIDKLVTEDLEYDFSNDDQLLPSIGEALKKLSQTHKISGVATLIIPGNLVLTRTIKVPYIEESKRSQIIAFEAQQSLPYSIDEVVWDSQVISDDGVEIEVLFIAAKSSIINGLCGYMSAAGFIVEKISAGTVLDYNTLQFAYPELNNDVLLINIGARSTNLLFRNKDGFYVRNIQLGGNSLTQNIADSLGRSFTRAEQIKKKFFGKEVDHSADDSRVKLLNSCAESFIRRMSQDINLSIVNYRRQKNGASPKRILVNGRGSRLKGLTQQLSIAQKVDVDFFNPLQNVILDGAMDAEMDVLHLQTSEIIGEACREMVPRAYDVNLLPDSIQTEVAFSRKKPYILTAAACLALAPLLPLLGYMQANSTYSEQVQMIESGLRPLLYNQAKIRKYKEKAMEVSQSIQRVESLINSKSNWIRFFAELQQSLHDAEDVWIDKLNVVLDQTTDGESTYEVVVAGKLLVREAVNGADNVDEDALSNQLNSLRTSFEDSEFVASTHSPMITWTNLHRGLYVLPFSINLVVDPAIPL